MNRDKQSSELLSNETYFAPAECDSQTQIASIHQLIKLEPHVQVLLDAMPSMVMILNAKRQIVFANQRVVEAIGAPVEAIIGKRPGELVDCVHAAEGPNGCGTSVPCRVCNAVNAIMKTQAKERCCTEECRILTESGRALDWKITTSPLPLAGQTLQCLVVEDISDRKRRQVLERTFFHDIINTIGGIVGFSRLMAEDQQAPEELQEVIRMADELLEEVQRQRELNMAENGDLTLKLETVELPIFLKQMAELYQNHPAAEARSIHVQETAEQTITSDVRLLKRVLGNMIKNALEASNEGEVVSIFARCQSQSVTIGVHNSAVMPDEVKLQVFNRSFSTKAGLGRGIGTYSMKLLGEQYLGGQVSFSSEELKGTIFSITLPQQ